MKIEQKNRSKIIPFSNNPRINDAAVEKVAASIKEFGFKQPIVVDKDMVVIAGHTRLKAAEVLGLETVPVLVADDLSPEQAKAYRLADNKTAEFSEWDFDLLNMELFDIGNIDMEQFGFDIEGIGDGGEEFFNDQEKRKDDLSEESEEYREFVKKFEAKKTTDDCYTPPVVYDAVAAWVAEKYGLDPDNFVRPFYPGGDFEKFKYDNDSVVVDNPPFSIFRNIINFYKEKSIKFFLFAPSLTIINYVDRGTAIALQASVTYENGAKVSTSFVTNLEPEQIAIRTDPELYKIVTEASKEFEKSITKQLPKYHYPDEVVTAAMMGRWSRYGVEQSFKTSECVRIDALDEQKKAGKAIFGKGLLLSHKAAAERAAAERWILSEREKEIVNGLDQNDSERNMEKKN